MSITTHRSMIVVNGLGGLLLSKVSGFPEVRKSDLYAERGKYTLEIPER